MAYLRRWVVLGMGLFVSVFICNPLPLILDDINVSVIIFVLFLLFL